MSLPDTIFIFGLALVIFGPKKLPEIGRQLGKLVLEFRRASNEFKMQIEEELRAAEAGRSPEADCGPRRSRPHRNDLRSPDLVRGADRTAAEQRNHGEHGKPGIEGDPGR